MAIASVGHGDARAHRFGLAHDVEPSPRHARDTATSMSAKGLRESNLVARASEHAALKMKPSTASDNDVKRLGRLPTNLPQRA